MTSLPVVAGTLQTDPRSGGLKRSSGVNVLPCVAEGASVRNVCWSTTLSTIFALTRSSSARSCVATTTINGSAWSEVRDDSNTCVDWIIVGYDGTSKTDITVVCKGSGGVDACSNALPEGQAVFGGCRLENGRFVTFFYADSGTPTMQKGRASMHKNGELSMYALDV